VLLAHALAILWLLQSDRVLLHDRPAPGVVTVPITLSFPADEARDEASVPAAAAATVSVERRRRGAAAPPSAAVTNTPPPRVDWSSEAPKSAARELARQAEEGRVARTFSGPQGTWPSLTKRQPSKLKKVPWKPGIDGPEYDEQGNPVFHVADGCKLTGAGTTQSIMLTCALGKPKADGDMFRDMREHFDEQRRPETDEGNGTEPEARRPP